MLCMITELHPLDPFLPENGTVLFLGSFPPPRNRWSMDFFYPNWQNDFWRIMGLLYFEDAHHFEVRSEKRFDKARIVAFCREKGFGFFDSAQKVCRLKGNASDNFLQIVEPADVNSLLMRMPLCHFVITTGGKSSEGLAGILSIDTIPEVGCVVSVNVSGRIITWYRVPSSSRAYPMPVSDKAAIYRNVLMEVQNQNG